MQKRRRRKKAVIVRFPGPVHSQGVDLDRWFREAIELEDSAFDTATRLYLEIVSIDPAYKRAWVNLAKCQMLRHAYAEAEASCRKALEVDPKYSKAWYNLGQVYDAQDQQTVAMEYYRTAVECDPRNSDAHYNLGFIYSQRGIIFPAIYHWKQYLAHAPSEERAVMDCISKRVATLSQKVTVTSRRSSRRLAS